MVVAERMIANSEIGCSSEETSGTGTDHIIVSFLSATATPLIPLLEVFDIPPPKSIIPGKNFFRYIIPTALWECILLLKIV
jgi:hypothetical protein